MRFRALVLDFDGLVIDSEETSLAAWRELYEAHGAALPLDEWLTLIGRTDAAFDPRRELERQAGRALPWERLEPELRARELALANALPPKPGLGALLADAERLALPLAVASSSSRRWVAGHLERLGIIDRFAALLTRDDVERAKPDPALYLAAAAALGVAPGEALAFEDSPNGVQAARAARVPVVAVPSALVRELSFAEADIVLASLTEAVPLEGLADRLAGQG